MGVRVGSEGFEVVFFFNDVYSFVQPYPSQIIHFLNMYLSNRFTTTNQSGRQIIILFNSYFYDRICNPLAVADIFPMFQF